MLTNAVPFVFKMIGNVLMAIGSLGSFQMCAALFHEIEVPEELKDLEF